MRMALLAVAGIILASAWLYPMKVDVLAASGSSEISKPAQALQALTQSLLGRNATIDPVSTLFWSTIVGLSLPQGNQLSLSWQQQMLASGPAKIVKSLLDFRQNAAMCLKDIRRSN